MLLARFEIPVSPVPASRPRVTRFRTYYPKRYSEYRKRVADWAADTSQLEALKELYGQPLCIVGLFVVERPKATKLEYPMPDVDNYGKALFDSLNGIAWRDDRDIAQTILAKMWARPNETGRTIVNILRPYGFDVPPSRAVR